MRDFVGRHRPIFDEGVLHLGDHRPGNLEMKIFHASRGSVIRQIPLGDVHSPGESPLSVDDQNLSVVAQVEAHAAKRELEGKEGRDVGPRELAKPAIEDWKALAERMRAEGAEKAHFDALDHPETPVEDNVLCEAAILKSKGLAALESPAADTLRPYVTLGMTRE